VIKLLLKPVLKLPDIFLLVVKYTLFNMAVFRSCRAARILECYI